MALGRNAIGGDGNTIGTEIAGWQMSRRRYNGWGIRDGEHTEGKLLLGDVERNVWVIRIS